MALICNHADAGTCAVYNNFKKKTKNKAVDVIYDCIDKYICAAISAHSDISHAGITPDEEVSRKISTAGELTLGDCECSHLTLLNLLRSKK
ncbi:MAG: hypothetical protein NTU63_00040 [Candidatus Pacearchaeota archaeon]|nr:hypothetical protein [Candidatus Pacearchaeota archaeon]